MNSSNSGDNDAWAVFATQPIRLVPRLTPDLTHDEVAQIVEDALSGSSPLRTRAICGW